MEEPPGECGCVGGDVSHAIHFYEVEGDDEYSFSCHVGGGSAGEVNKRSGGGLNQGERLQIIRDFCRDPDVKYLRVSWSASLDYRIYWREWNERRYDECKELWVELMEGLQGRSILKCLVISFAPFMDDVFAVVHLFCKTVT